MGTGSRFDAFISNIQLTAAQAKDAVTKHTGVRDCLNKHYYTASATGTSLLVGSYGKRTACRPPTDVDILFVIPSSLFQRYNDWGGQSRLLQDVKVVLKSTYLSTVMRADGQVVVVSFANSFGVEVLPVFANFYNGEEYFTPDTHNGGSWKTTNPSAQKRFITDSNSASSGNTVDLVKMMKVWRHYCNVPITSFAIELTAVPFLSQWEHRGKTSTYYDYMVRDYLSFLLTRAGGYESIPGSVWTYGLGDAWKSKAQSAYDRAVKACGYEAYPTNESMAIEEWKKIFGGFYTGQA